MAIGKHEQNRGGTMIQFTKCRAVAIHEAMHGMCAHALGLPVLKIDIGPALRGASTGKHGATTIDNVIMPLGLTMAYRRDPVGTADHLWRVLAAWKAPAAFGADALCHGDTQAIAEYRRHYPDWAGQSWAHLSTRAGNWLFR
jgi:hypothetical protein